MASDSQFPTGSKTTFPLEIFRLIFDHCDFSTLKCFRLSCHALEVDIAARIFGSLHFDLLPRSLEITRRVADHPILATHVREIVISDNLLKEYTYEGFRRQLCSVEPGGRWWAIPPDEDDVDPAWSLETDLAVSKDWLRQSFEIYCKYLQAQKSIVAHEAKLNSVFPKLTRLKRIWLRTLDDTEQSQSWVAFSIHVFGVPDCFSLRLWTTFLSSGNNTSALHMILCSTRHMLQLVQSVKIDYVPSHFWYTHSISEGWNSIVNLDLRLEQGQSERRKVLVKCGIRELLRRLDSIEFLRLEITPSCGYFTRLDFAEVFLDIKLTLLQNLQVQTGIIKSKDLLKICENHKDTLRSLSIVDFHLGDSSWECVYPLIVKSLPDSSIMFEGLTDGDGWTTHTALPFGQHMIFDGK